VVLTAVGFAVALLADAGLGTAALVCAGILLLCALAAASGWRAARSEAAHARHAAALARDAQQQDRGRLERHARRLEQQRDAERRLLQRLRASWKAEREWNRELRTQLQRLQPMRGQQTGNRSVGELILTATMQIVDAEKGMLISREDEDSDGALDVVIARGFEHDPADSAVAQRFARDVLARDEIIREDDPHSAGDSATPADEEIRSLVAIPLFIRDRFHGVIVCANRPEGFEELGDELLLALGDHAGAALQHGRLQHQLRDARREAVRVLAEAVAAHDPVLHRETRELAVHAGLLAEDLRLDPQLRDALIAATLLRAVGYLALPERPRLRPGPLSPEERSLIELHARLGFNIIARAPTLQDAATAVLYHHEWYDGQGYPAGLAGRAIPIAARILAVVEAYGAMTHERPYREPCTREDACDALVAGAGTQFDPEVTHRFVEQVRRSPQITAGDVAAAVVEDFPLEPGAFSAADVDGFTLLGTLQRLHADASEATERGRPYSIAVVELMDVARINAEAGHEAGDRLIEEGARATRRAAARLGGTAYRVSGRRLAILLPVRDGVPEARAVEQIEAEFLGGPAVRVGLAGSSQGEDAAAVIFAARRAVAHG
jgi:HD-GYP domain-containing protein (c-di-GMP phosphodiesterase class II)